MTGQQLFDLFKELVDDNSFDEDSFYILLNVSKTKIETDREWEFLKTDKRYSITGDYNALYTLETNYGRPLQFNGLYVNRKPYTMCRPERWEEFYDRDGYFTIKSGKLRISGNPNVGLSALFNYIMKTTAISSSVSCIWPEEDFQPLLAFETAMNFMFADGVEPARDKAPQWYAQYLAVKSAMIQWDANLKLAYQNTYND